MLGFKILIVVAVLAVNFASSEVSDDLLRELKGSDVVLCASDAFVNQDSECDEACQKLDKKLSGFCNYKIKQCKCTITGRESEGEASLKELVDKIFLWKAEAEAKKKSIRDNDSS